jgi:hypothetical protein
MIVETRKSAQGTEYWDNKAKKVLFVPAGQKPGFEVTKNPKSMLDKDNVINTLTDINLADMNAEQLLAFAKQNDIEVPGNIKKEETIRKHIEEVLTANDSE